MLDPNGRVKLGDFGVARITDGGEATRTQGSMVGTLKYMSPEQVIGAKVDARTDLFAAGVVLYQLVTGTKPFEGDGDFAIMQAIAQQDPPRPSTLNLSLPAGVDAVVFKALAKNRDNRYASAKDFALALRAVTQHAAAGIHPPPPPAPPPSRSEAGAGATSTGTGGGRTSSGGTSVATGAINKSSTTAFTTGSHEISRPRYGPTLASSTARSPVNRHSSSAKTSRGRRASPPSIPAQSSSR